MQSKPRHHDARFVYQLSEFAQLFDISLRCDHPYRCLFRIIAFASKSDFPLFMDQIIVLLDDGTIMTLSVDREEFSSDLVKHFVQEFKSTIGIDSLYEDIDVVFPHPYPF